MPQSLLNAKNLTQHFGDITAVDNISMHLERGEVLGLLGLNGAGKSSTLRMLAGVKAPASGDVLIDGYNVHEQPKSAKSRLGFLPEVAPLYPEMKVQEFLRFAAQIRGIPRQKIKRRVPALMDELGLENHAKRTIGNLSKGYKQRVGIAQAIVHQPPLVILDEPGSGLDPEQMKDMRELIGRLGENNGVIFSSHLLSEVTETCQRVIVIHEGKIVYEGNLDDGFEQSNLGQHPDGEVARTKQIARFGKSITADALRAIDRSIQCEKISAGRWGLNSTHNPDVLLNLLIGAGLPVIEFGPDRPSLETLFSSLVNGRARDAKTGCTNELSTHTSATDTARSSGNKKMDLA